MLATDCEQFLYEKYSILNGIFLCSLSHSFVTMCSRKSVYLLVAFHSSYQSHVFFSPVGAKDLAQNDYTTCDFKINANWRQCKNSEQIKLPVFIWSMLLFFKNFILSLSVSFIICHLCIRRKSIKSYSNNFRSFSNKV